MKAALGGLACAVLFCLPAASASAGAPALEITLAHDSAAEHQTQAQLEGLLDRYDLSKWIVTDKLAIDQDAIPHSHPLLTLHTRHRRDDELLLSTFVHEETHWFIALHRDEMQWAERDLRRLFPKLPLDYPKGSDTQQANYEHLIIILNEWRACRELFGELKAREVMEFWAHDHYTTLYQLVLDHPAEIGKIAREHHLLVGQ